MHINMPSVLGVMTKLDVISQKQDATTVNPLAGQTGWNYFDRQYKCYFSNMKLGELE